MNFSPNEVEESRRAFVSAMKLMDVWLGKTKYICGDEISIADLTAICEVTQLGFISKDISEYTNVSRWVKEMREIPEVKKVHEFLDQAIKKTQEAKIQEAKL